MYCPYYVEICPRLPRFSGTFYHEEMLDFFGSQRFSESNVIIMWFLSLDLCGGLHSLIYLY